MRLNQTSADRLRQTGIYGLFAIYMLLMHLPLPYCGDDAYLLPLVGVRGFWEHFTTLYHYNGKIFTDFSAFLFYHLPYGVWKVFNTASFVLAAVLLCRIFTKNRPRDGLITCALVNFTLLRSKRLIVHPSMMQLLISTPASGVRIHCALVVSQPLKRTLGIRTSLHRLSRMRH